MFFTTPASWPVRCSGCAVAQRSPRRRNTHHLRAGVAGGNCFRFYASREAANCALPLLLSLGRSSRASVTASGVERQRA
jgi:hypothetical protein